MLISNGNIQIFIDESSGTVEFIDGIRGVNWKLDYPELVYTSVTFDEETIHITYGDVVFAFVLHEDYIEIQLLSELLSDDIKSVVMPSSCLPVEGTKKHYILPIMQGMLWDCGGEPFETYRHESGHTGFAMPMFGLLSDKGGYIYIAETMDNCGWKIGKDANGRTWCCNIQSASLGKMDYTRIGRIYFTNPTITKAAKCYKSYVKSKGRFITFAEKLETRPELKSLFGTLMCYIGYCQDDIDYVTNFRRLKNYGFDKALIYPVRFNTYTEDFLMGGVPPINLSDDEIAAIKEIGYDIAPWTWINEAIDDGTDKIRNMYRKNKDGSTHLGWQIDNFKYSHVCTTFMEEFYASQRSGKFKEMTWDHFDVITCATNNECYALDHPAHLGRLLSKTEDRAYLRKLLARSQSFGGAVSSEGFNDAYSMEYDLGSVKAWAQYDNFIFKPIPFTMLVYHDSIIHSWWEPHNYNSKYFGRNMSPFYQYGGGMYELQATMDALYGCPPDVFPFGAQYGWTGNGSETMLYKFRFDDPETQHALKIALPVAKNHEKIGMLEMIDFDFLSEDRNIQRTVFADGSVVYANFGLGSTYDKEYGTLLPKDWTRVE